MGVSPLLQRRPRALPCGPFSTWSWHWPLLHTPQAPHCTWPGLEQAVEPDDCNQKGGCMEVFGASPN